MEGNALELVLIDWSGGHPALLGSTREPKLVGRVRDLLADEKRAQLARMGQHLRVAPDQRTDQDR